MQHITFCAESLKSVVTAKKHFTLLKPYLSKQVWSPKDREDILNTLSELLLSAEISSIKDVMSCLGPVAIDIIYRLKAKLRAEKANTEISSGMDVIHILELRICTILGVLCEAHIPVIKRILVEYFQEFGHPFGLFSLPESAAHFPTPSKRRKTATSSMSLDTVVFSLLKIMNYCPVISTYDWPWDEFVGSVINNSQLTHPGRWALMKIVGNLLKMKSEDIQYTLDDSVDLWKEEYNSCKKPEIEWTNESSSQHAVVSFSDKNMSYTKNALASSDLSSDLVTICGVLLPKAKMQGFGNVPVPTTLTMTESMRATLQQTALAVASGQPVLLEGPSGCGKSAVVGYLASVTGQARGSYIKVQLGDGMDSKVLTGTYKCTAVPGEFVWQPGVLTQAVQNGNWILMEDIDKAPMDVISLLMPLMEQGSLKVHGHSSNADDKNAFASGFRLFMTRSTMEFARSESSAAVSMLSKHARTVRMSAVSFDDLKIIIVDKFPKLASIAEKLLTIYTEVEGKDVSGRVAFSGSARRKPSIRDLFKLCGRLSTWMLNDSSVDLGTTVAMEAVDCFLGSCADELDRDAKLHTIYTLLNLSTTKGDYYCQSYMPEVVIKPDKLAIGRVTVQKSKRVVAKMIRQPFALTRSSSVLLEKVACAVASCEPVLLVGETGVGKTSAVQFLAEQLGRNLHTLSMSQQSSASDLLGAFKPTQPKHLLSPVRDEFERLFTKTFSQSQNVKFLKHIQTCFFEKRYKALLQLMSHCLKIALKKVNPKDNKDAASNSDLCKSWEELSQRIMELKHQLDARSALAFSFVEGILSQALKSGDWLLLDEINLASPETLDCLAGVIESQKGSVALLEIGDSKPLKRHPDFRIFAAMNPATDVGKKNLPPNIRNRFIEFYVSEPKDDADLRTLILYYLKRENAVDTRVVDGILTFYKEIRKLSVNELVDGIGRRPHFSLRTLCRALRFVADNPGMSLLKALYEGLCLSFLTELDHTEHEIVRNLIINNVIGKAKSKAIMKSPMPPPGYRHVTVQGYHIRQGDLEPTTDKSYIMTDSVKKNLKILSRAVSYGRYPILIQGETSTGKTSIIRYLATMTGNVVTRINNHEHTDLDELVGCYISCSDGRLVFQEGPLVTAMRKGYWIILDELNLAPTDILESLNRVLDDNRELYIPETHERVTAHPRFTLFATQNPPGVYGGRKVLSRALRNRFIELHFGEVPSEEIQTILHQRCSLPLSRCKKLVNVMKDLQAHRRTTGIFAGKHGFITLRDLFRWAERYRLDKGETDAGGREIDWDQRLAESGYLLLAGRVRKQEEEQLIREVLQKRMGKKIVPDDIFSEEVALHLLHGSVPEGFEHVVLTKSLRRMLVMLQHALKFDEPVLLVGETGCGKTTACQIVSAAKSQNLSIINCHSHTDASDFLGGLRPVRDHGTSEEAQRLFEWVDGPLVRSMETGSHFLVDEISLAEDSVLERLNSVLEVERTLVISDKMDANEEQASFSISANDGFQFMATMNPGGDFGKKELSPALRNRLTEIWCNAVDENDDDVKAIVVHNLKLPQPYPELLAPLIVQFIHWFTSTIGSRHVKSMRDVMKWVSFMNVSTKSCNAMKIADAYVHAALLVFIDGIGSGLSSAYASHCEEARTACVDFILKQLERAELDNQLSKECKLHLRSLVQIESSAKDAENITYEDDKVGIVPFYIFVGPQMRHDSLQYSFNAPTTSINCFRLLRALQLSQPVLLEGSPGIGKTSLVGALAKAAGHKLVRINLSEQTDVSDLFGADLPVEGGVGGQFDWRDGPLLSALKDGSWVVFDELNLASQSVLEGLNSVLDHRAELFVPELGRTFRVNAESTRIFACQNPQQQGGGRKGLPKSFLNRFNQVYMDTLSAADLLLILLTQFPGIQPEMLNKMLQFNKKVNSEIVDGYNWAQRGSPWEFNLRDLTRWCDLILSGNGNPAITAYLIYCERLQTVDDRVKMCSLFMEVFEDSTMYQPSCQFHISPELLQVGNIIMSRKGYPNFEFERDLQILPSMLHSMESLMTALKQGWMCILTGQSGSGKSSLVSTLAALTGNTLRVFPVNSSMDATELLGGFEQSDFVRSLSEIIQRLSEVVLLQGRNIFSKDMTEDSTFTSTKMMLKAMQAINKCKSNVVDATNIDAAIACGKEFCDTIESVTALFKSVGVGEEELSSLSELLSKTRELTKKFSTNWKGTYEWIDSTLIDALENGHWLLVDGANLCNPSVLDRLNALLEPNGVLSVTERGIINGSIVEIRPHPEFRLILCLDPSQGNLSRAMRNRGVEIFMMSELSQLVPYHFNGAMTWCEVEQTVLFKLSKLTSLHEKLRQHLAHCIVKFFEITHNAGSHLSSSLFSATKCLQSVEEICERILSGYDATESVLLICSRITEENACSSNIMDLQAMLVAEGTSLFSHVPVISVEKMLHHTMAAQVFLQAQFFNSLQDQALTSGVEFSDLLVASSSLFINLSSVKDSRSRLQLLSDYFENRLTPISPEMVNFTKHLTKTMEKVIKEAVLDDVIFHRVHGQLGGMCSKEYEGELELLPWDPRWTRQFTKIAGLTINPQCKSKLNLISLTCMILVRREVVAYQLNNSVLQDAHNVRSTGSRTKKKRRAKSVSKACNLGGLVLSFKYHNASVRLQDLPHPAVAYLYPLQQKISACILSLARCPEATLTMEDELNDAFELVSRIHYIWRYFLEWRPFDTSVFSLQCKRLQSYTRSLTNCILGGKTEQSEGFSEVQKCFETMDSLLDIQQITFQEIELQSRLHRVTGRHLVGALPYRGQRQMMVEDTANNIIHCIEKEAVSRSHGKTCDQRVNLTQFMMKVCKIVSQLRMHRTEHSCHGDDNNHDEDTRHEQIVCELSQILQKLRSIGYLTEFKSPDLENANFEAEPMEDDVTHGVVVDCKFSSTAFVLSLRTMMDFVFFMTKGNEDDGSIYGDLVEKLLQFLAAHGVLNSEVLTRCFVLQNGLTNNSNRPGTSRQAQMALLALIGDVKIDTEFADRKSSQQSYSFNPCLLGAVDQSIYERLGSNLQSNEGSSSKTTTKVISTPELWDNFNVSLLQYKNKKQQLCLLRNMLWMNGNPKSCCEGFPGRGVIDGVCLLLSHITLTLQMSMDASGIMLNLLEQETSKLLEKIKTTTQNLLAALGKRFPMEETFSNILTNFQVAVTSVSGLCQPSSQLKVTSLWLKQCQKQFFISLSHLLSMLERFHECFGELGPCDREKKTLAVWLSLAQSWIWISSLTLVLITPQHELDPLEKHRSKSAILQHQLSSLKHETTAMATYYRITTGKDLYDEKELDAYKDNLHPRVPSRFRCLSLVQKKSDKLATRSGYRPSADQFKKLVSCCKQTSAMLSPDHLQILLGQFEEVAELLSRCEKLDGKLPALLNSSHALEKMQHSVINFSRQLREYPACPDFTIPIQDALISLNHGLDLASSLVDVAAFSGVGNEVGMTLEEFFSVLMGLNTNFAPSTFLSFAARLSAVIPEIGIDVIQMQNVGLVERVILVLLMKYASGVMFRGESCTEFCHLLKLLDFIIKRWNDQREAEESGNKPSAYKQISHLEALDENHDEDELQKMFPEHALDAAEEHATSPEAPGDASDSDIKVKQLLNDHIMKLAMVVHGDVMDRTGAALCYESTKKIEKPVKNRGKKSRPCQEPVNRMKKNVQLSEPMLHAHHHFHSLLQSMSGNMLNNSIDSELADVPHLIVKKISEHLEGVQGTGGVLNIHLEASPGNASRCLPILQNLRNYVEGTLLSEWPEQPTLVKIVLVIDRILGFSVHSPLMKFVTGLELLLSQAQEWEKNAASRVSLQSHLVEITNLVLDWRKMELKCWGLLLDEALKKQSSISPDLYFSTYQLLLDGEGVEIGSIISSLQQFMESSTISEYSGRLNVLRTFLQHLCLRESKQEVKTALWNTYQYYSLFNGAVLLRIEELQKPIEKELKDFVKIAKWNDINFYAVKDSIDKSHRHLFKLVKKFTSVIKESVRTNVFAGNSNNKLIAALSTECDSSEERKKDDVVLVALDEKALTIPSMEYLMNIGPDSVPKLLHRLPSLLPKLRSVCLNWSQSRNGVSMKLDVLEEFIADVICNAQRLRDLEPTTPDSKSDENIKKKRLSEAKSIQLRKRKALNDLFKHLTELGLSYRKGIIYGREYGSEKLLLAPIVNPSQLERQDVAVEISDVPGNVSCSRMDASEEKGKEYFYQNISKWSALSISLNVPHKDIARGSVERARGFVGHLMKMSFVQRRWLSKVSVFEKRVGRTITSLQNCTSSAVFPAQPICHKTMTSLKTAVDDWCLSLHHFSIWVDSCPGERYGGGRNEMLTPSPSSFLSPMQQIQHGNTTWTLVMQKVKKCLEIGHKVKSLVDGEVKKIESHSAHLISEGFLHSTVDELSLVGKLSSDLSEFVTELFKAPARPQAELPHMVSKLFGHSDTLKSLCESLEISLKSPVSENGECSEQNAYEDLTNEAELGTVTEVLAAANAVLSSVLVSIQGLKKHVVGGRGEVEDLEVDNEQCLKTLQKYLREGLSMLNLESTCGKMEDFVGMIAAMTDPKLLKLVQDTSHSLLPMLQELHQVIHSLRSFAECMHRTTSKLCYVLSAIFIELSRNGFCPPAGFEESDLEEGSTEFTDIDEGGIGEGEGMTDVSDKIEDQEQIESKAGDENKNDNKEIPEAEDNAIENDEDFDAECEGGVEDSKEDNEDSDEDGDDEEDELEKQMGELGDDATEDKLDERIWGSDDEEEEKEESETAEKGKGMDKSESELAAKDDNLNDPSDENENQDNPEESEKNNEKPNDTSEFNPDETDDQYNQDEEERKEDHSDLPEECKITDEDEEDQEEPNLDEVKELTDIPDGEDDQKQEDEEKPDETGENAADDGEDVPAEDLGEGEKEIETAASDDEKLDGEADEKDDTDAYIPDKRHRGVGNAEDSLQDSNIDENSENTEQAEIDEKNLNDDSRMDNQKTGVEDEAKGDGNAPLQGDVADDATSLSTNFATQGMSHDAEDLPNTSRKPLQNAPKRTLDNESSKTSVKRLKLVSDQQKDDETKPNNQRDEIGMNSEMYQHVEDADSAYDKKTLDLVTEEQNQEDMSVDVKDETESAKDMEEQVMEPSGILDEDKQVDGTLVSTEIQKHEEGPAKDLSAFEEQTDELLAKDPLSREKKSEPMDVVLPLSAIYTDVLQGVPVKQFAQRSDEEVEKIRRTLEEQLQSWKQGCDVVELNEAELAWQKCCTLTQPLAMQLTEQLRLILEPTEAAQLKGDYRTGKRLNMRKVIPYIASGFRKDKIWLRRHKPSKRKYQVLLAIDDSSSMIDNHSKQLAYESVSVISTALSTLDAGQLGICSFGEAFQVVQDFNEPFTTRSGAAILSRCAFSQKKTKIAEFLDSSIDLLHSAGRQYSSNANPNIAQLLLIISDGRGLYLEGRERVIRAVRAVREAGIFVAFIIIDQPSESVRSILDIKVPVFAEPGKMPEIRSYMDDFPFPFYLILRDINVLPQTLGDALRQWFELIVESV